MNLEEASDKLEKSTEFFSSELKRLRGGRVSPSIVDDIEVEAYGDKMPINQLGSVSVADASLLVINLWDKSVVEDVRKAIETSDLGITPQIDGQLIRLPVPPMSQERREEITKLVKVKEEEAKVVVRQIRKDCLTYYDNEQKAKSISEDEYDRLKDQLQKLVDEANKKLEEIAKLKEEEIMTI
ncbi:ribosome recycling factor [Candidatus Dojkabacteria bacterium]|uniref:Ribosome-recycling factor n=1 Tax=Candidatus Dojkabacteria bacterium TaxID=2099670 RepID=A0A955RHN6_9BACT|nr:ribosome recycling factor [Candidatus Dojkabacteria bacterium]